MRFLVGVVLACLNATVALGDGPLLSDQEAIAAYEQVYAVGRIQAGKLTIVGDQFGGGGDHVLSASAYQKWYLPYVEEGLVKAVPDKGTESFNTGKTFSWDKFLALTTQGVQHVIYLSLTPEGIAAGGTQVGDSITYPGLRPFGVQIVSKTQLTSGTDTYAVVKATGAYSDSPWVRKTMLVCGHPLSLNFRAVWLFKYDDFDRKWTIGASDWSNRDTDFCTGFVNDALSKLK